ncbi:recombinase family protein [Ammoniphilus resinae]|uniref:DNA invertase Pin-like site-specific DNA recombinase/DNA-binding protein H-NS n=1 Tax=Ammoniphilus resinae TaxID=861532 RepID=A0ABS4GTR0_9BACL|nr:recombinase family protein [Ammoniphilus resinae]MBP1933665.1 DNA invertase Pin-like site-specific DNA recombinase/DNA-binding protein H-NS [Ammoniphilus resinae]
MIKKVQGSIKYPNDELMVLVEQIKAIIYVRVSTADQAIHGYSLESQMERCIKHAKEKFNYTECQLMVVIEPGEQGDNPDRPGLNHVLYLLENSVGRKLVILHPDRLSRYLALQTEITQRVWNAGCDLEFVEFQVDPNNPESMLMYNIQGSIAQYNKAKILANSKRGRKQMIKNGKIPGINRVYGYKYDKDLDTLVEDPYEKEVYLKMVDWMINGKDGEEMTCTKIAIELCKQDVPGPKGPIWYQTTVSRILHNDIYLGKFYYGKTEIVQQKGKKIIVEKPREEWLEIEIPRYISEDDFNKVQIKLRNLIKKNRGRETQNYILKGICRCGRCGGALVAGPPSRLKNGTLFYYTCVNKAKKGFRTGTGEAVNVCRGRNWRQDVIDDYVWKYLKQYIQNPDQIIKEILDQQDDINKLEELNLKEENLLRVIEKKQKERKKYQQLFVKDLITETELEGNLKPLNGEVQQLEVELEFIRNTKNRAKEKQNDLGRIKETIKKYQSTLSDLTIETKRKLVQILVSKVILNEDTIQIVTRWKPENDGQNSTHPHSNSNPRQRVGGL